MSIISWCPSLLQAAAPQSKGISLVVEGRGKAAAHLVAESSELLNHLRHLAVVTRRPAGRVAVRVDCGLPAPVARRLHRPAPLLLQRRELQLVLGLQQVSGEHAFGVGPCVGLALAREKVCRLIESISCCCCCLLFVAIARPFEFCKPALKKSLS